MAGLRYFHTGGVFNSVVFLNPDGSTSPIKPNGKYTIVSTDYLLQGGDGFGMFKGAEVLQPAGLPYAQLVIEDLKLFPQGVSGTGWLAGWHCAGRRCLQTTCASSAGCSMRGWEGKGVCVALRLLRGGCMQVCMPRFDRPLTSWCVPVCVCWPAPCRLRLSQRTGSSTVPSGPRLLAAQQRAQHPG